MRVLRWINYNLYKFQKTFIVVIFLALLILSFAQVVLRLFFRSGIEGADSIIRYLVMWVGFLGASLATYKNRHINIDIVTQFIKNINKRVIGAIVNFAAFVICGFFLKSSIYYLIYAASRDALMHIPKWVLELALPIAFFFMALRFLQNFLEAIVGRRRVNYPERDYTIQNAERRMQNEKDVK